MSETSQYLYKIQPTRLEMLTDPTEKESEIVSLHYAYLKELTEEGTVILAGRTLNIDDSSFGIIVFEAESEKTAQEIVDKDPGVRNGVFRAELYPYRVALIRG